MAHPIDFEKCISRSIQASIQVKELLLGQTEVLSLIAEVSQVLIDTFRTRSTVFLFGNGGSAADAQHIAAEFVGRFAFERTALPAVALNENVPSITAIGNDCGFEQIFSRQIAALASPGDVAIGISTSGRSPNVIHAMATAKAMRLRTVAFTGAKGTEPTSVDHCIRVPSTETPRIQECHILIGHIITELVEQTMFPDEYASSRRAKS